MAQGNDNRKDVVSSQFLTEETTNTRRQRLAAGTLTYPPPELYFSREQTIHFTTSREMAQGNEGDDNPNAVDSSHLLAAETTKTQRQRMAAGTLTCPPKPELPTLPFDLLPEILCRLPVKLLRQLRCLCKFFNSLFSDPKFAKKHLQLSTKRHHLMVTSKKTFDDYFDEYVQYDSPIPSVFSTSTVVTQTQLHIPNGHDYLNVLCSCDGMFCGELNLGSYFLWNPSIRKFKLLPPLENSPGHVLQLTFGYDHFIHNYKLIVDSNKNEVFVYTFGTDYWTTINNIPYDYSVNGLGFCVSGAVNWYAKDKSDNSLYFILSLDLKNESYQQLYLPDFENESYFSLGVLRDCLCVFATSDIFFNVWIMNEYRKKESWTKLYTIPNLQLQDRGLLAFTALYISEDDQLLVECGELDDDTGYIKLVVYDSKTGTLNSPEFQNNDEHTDANVYIESLISP